jgi:Arm DNA-binding domain
MGIEPMPITDTTCRTGKSREKPYKLSDGGGIYLLVEKNGSKLWCHAFRIDGKQKLVALDAYPRRARAATLTRACWRKALTLPFSGKSTTAPAG